MQVSSFRLEFLDIHTINVREMKKKKKRQRERELEPMHWQQYKLQIQLDEEGRLFRCNSVFVAYNKHGD